MEQTSSRGGVYVFLSYDEIEMLHQLLLEEGELDSRSVRALCDRLITAADAETTTEQK
jgi:hypothetical protein